MVVQSGVRVEGIAIPKPQLPRRLDKHHGSLHIPLLLVNATPRGSLHPQTLFWS